MFQEPHEELRRLRAAVAALQREPSSADRSSSAHAAVAMVFSPDSRGHLSLLMIKRAEYEGDPWSGHMAFPGGRLDPGDASPLAAARRETLEEVGLDLAAATPLGPLPVIRTPTRLLRSSMSIHPFVFAFDRPLPPLTLEVKEVASAHRFEAHRLLADEGRATFPWVYKQQRLRMPCIVMDGCKIWGLSLQMLDPLLERMRHLNA